MATYSADFSATHYDGTPVGSAAAGRVAETAPQTPDEVLKAGARIYANVCQACHQPHGNGGSGNPPLNGSEWVAGDKASAARLSRILLYGLNGPITVKGTAYNGQMPSHGGALKDWQIAAVLTYVRNSWDNKAEPVTVADVATARGQEGKRPTNNTASMTQEQLEAIPIAPPKDAGGGEKK
jgi:mono/diheme cytochrome c family protein